MANLNSFHNDLKIAKELVYDVCNFTLSNPKLNSESEDYAACSFELNNKIVQYRASKITPTKAGQFVTIWKRNKNGITEPFDVSDEIDFIIISSRSDDNFGQFIFPKNVLADKGILTQNGVSGKRGIRVYPPWDIPKSKQAEKTQNWQINYFVTIKTNAIDNLDLAKKLLNQSH